MAVESKQGNNTTNGTEQPQPMLASGSSPNVKRAPRTSALMKAASKLPTVEHSLEAFIAKANETMVDVGSWGAADQAAKEAEEKRREQDALRWKQAEQQMRDNEQREQAMRRQLDGLQGKLAEAEARAAVAGALSGSSQNDAALAELKKQIEETTERMRAAEDKAQQVQRELVNVRMTGSMPAVTPLEVNARGTEERVRLAEAKATKAIAAARAAQAGLTVSSADIAAIESGLVVPMAPRKRSPILAITLAFVGGLGIMFAVWKFGLSKDDATPAAATVTQPVAAPNDTPAPAAKPSVTPIDDQASATPTVKVIPIEEPGAAPAVVPAPAVEPAKAEAPKSEPKAVAKRAKKPSRTKKEAAATAPTTKSKGKFVDPFADEPTAAAKPAEKKKSEKLVDPF